MNTFCRILARYGEDTKIEFGDVCIYAKTFVQPAVKSGNTHVTHLGRVNDGDYYWFAPGYLDLDTEENITVTTSDGIFDVERVEKYRVLGQVSHWEAVLKRRY